MNYVLILFCCFLLVQSRKWNTHASRKADAALNVHIVCHTHDDTGWLKTVDQYYVGLNNSIQRASVALILDTVVPELQKNPDRKFIYVEQAFFQRWWREQTSQMQTAVKALVASGQLVFINGGYCMHDEAAVHYMDMIDQTTTGQQFIVNEFGTSALPKAGWQIDPFGHSATHAALISASLFDSLFLGRIDYEDRAKRVEEKNMEFIWRGSASLGAESDIWTSCDYGGNYNPPPGLCFDISCSDEPIQDDPSLEDMNVKAIVEEFVLAAQSQAKHYQGNDVIFKMGSDFQYRSARHWYKNLDKLIHYVNEDGRVNAFYSTPVIYAQAKASTVGVNWTVKTDDFFPYADVPHGYWTGYFTSRPLLKRMVRESSAFLQTARHLDLFNAGNGSALGRYNEEQGLVQHHDAVSGTEKQHVAYDYAKRLSQGISDGEIAVANGLRKLLGDSSLNFYQCRLINESVCSFTANTLNFAIVIYNPQARSRNEIIRVPINNLNAQVYDSTGVNRIQSQIEDVAFSPIPRDPANPPASYMLYFQATLPALGYTTYFVTTGTAEERLVKEPEPNAPIILDNEYLRVVYDSTTGLLESITNKPNGISATLSQQFLLYQSYGLEDLEQKSGAYIFRPLEERALNINVQPKITSSTGNVFQSVTQSWDNWLNQTVRLYNNERYLEFEWTVGPVPIDDDVGKEIITRFTSDIVSGETYYTDANGREMLQRVKNYRPTWNLTITEPVAGNYYPIDSAIFIKDKNRQLTVLTDRAQGGGSIENGQIELMVHRRILKDDSRGVGEPLNETLGITGYPNPQRLGPGIVVRGKHRLVFEAQASSASVWRPLAQSVFSQPNLAFTPISTSPSTWASTHRTKASGSTELPPNVDIITLAAQGDGVGLLRLAHEFAYGEDPNLSKPVTVDLSKLFLTFNLNSVTEYTLTGTQPKPTKNGAKFDYGKVASAAPAGNITLNPMEIKTYQINYVLL